jgi:hypothetical protein
VVNQKPAVAKIHTKMSEEKRKKRQTRRSVRRITRKALNSAASEKKRMDQADLERQNKVKGTKNLLNSLGKYGKGKK